jgi:Subtilisin inhibitor-like
MRPLTRVVAGVAATALCATAAATPSSKSALLVVFKRSEQAKPVVRRLNCTPPGGTVLQPARACAGLEDMARPFAPVPRNAVCTEIYGGPQTARVTGSFRGRRIWVVFRRTNGCEIDRWDRHAFLFPSGS